MTYNVVQPQMDYSTAQEFLNALSPWGSNFGDAKLTDYWLFRGQGEDKPLVPSLFRKNNKLASLTRRTIDAYPQLLLAERDILIQFFEIADKRGLVLPDDSQDLRSILETIKSKDLLVEKGLDSWSPTKLALSLTALAQHYGIPTRLLDWTRQSFIAAFFAAESALKVDKTDSLLVVWAFLFPLFGKHDDISKDTDPVHVVTAPSATNPNLKAQQGVFTLLNRLYTKESEGDYPSMDKFLEDLAHKADPEHSDPDKLIVGLKLRKFTLPVSEASKLLYLLAKLDITPSAIYPGYHSIVSDMQIQNTWE